METPERPGSRGSRGTFGDVDLLPLLHSKRELIWTFNCCSIPQSDEIEGQKVVLKWTVGGYYYSLLELRSPRAFNLHLSKPTVRLPIVWRDRENEVEIRIERVPGVQFEVGTTPEATQLHTTLRWLQEREVSFRLPHIAYRSEKNGYSCTAIRMLPGRPLANVLGEILGMDVTEEGKEVMQELGPYGNAIKAQRICENVSEQVLEAVLQMSRWEGDGIKGVDGLPLNDGKFSEYGTWRLFTDDEIRENCHFAGLDCENTVFTPGSLSPYDILIDDDYNFTGFRDLRRAGFAPPNWIQAGFVDPEEKANAGISVRWSGLLPGRERVPAKGSVRLIWHNTMTDKLAHAGFAKIDPFKLPWLRRRDKSLYGRDWRDLDADATDKGLESWDELLYDHSDHDNFAGSGVGDDSGLWMT